MKKNNINWKEINFLLQILNKMEIRNEFKDNFISILKNLKNNYNKKIINQNLKKLKKENNNIIKPLIYKNINYNIVYIDNDDINNLDLIIKTIIFNIFNLDLIKNWKFQLNSILYNLSILYNTWIIKQL